jgi:hypothetical protein
MAAATGKWRRFAAALAEAGGGVAAGRTSSC